MHAKLLGTVGTALALLVLAGTSAEAQWRSGPGSGAYESGYRDGARAGDDDARDGRGYEYQRHRDYRSADRGYDRLPRGSVGICENQLPVRHHFQIYPPVRHFRPVRQAHHD